METILFLCLQVVHPAVLHAAIAIRSERDRSFALATLAPSLTDFAHLRQVRCQTATDLRTLYRQSPRADLIRYLVSPSLVVSPSFTPNKIAAIAAAIIDVTTKWRWL